MSDTVKKTASQSTNDLLRAYIIKLRNAKDLTQDGTAKKIGLSRRAYLDWETGVTDEIKLSFFMRLINLLGGSLEDVSFLLAGQATAADVERLANQVILRSVLEVIQDPDAKEKLQTPEDVERFLAYFREEMKRFDEEERRRIMDRFSGMIDAWRNLFAKS
jgi:transcriptional regulator with XRE-family HTH domain